MTEHTPNNTKLAFEAFLEGASLSNEKDKDVWGAEIYKHQAIESMWFAWQEAYKARSDITEELLEALEGVIGLMPEFTDEEIRIACALNPSLSKEHARATIRAKKIIKKARGEHE